MQWLAKFSGFLSENDIIELVGKFRLHSYPVNNILLTSIMKILRTKRSKLPLSYTYSLTRFDDLLQLWIQSPACRFSEAGFCSVCNYWNGSKIENIASKIISSAVIDNSVHSILLNTCGSVLDDYELPREERKKILIWLKSFGFKKIIFETNITTLNYENLEEIARIFTDEKIFFEVGIESVHNDILFFCYNKLSHSDEYENLINKIHKYKNFSIIANVMLGAPFLTRCEQEYDALQSIISLLDCGFDYVVLFPVNIKPQTLPELLIRLGFGYSRIKGSSLISVLNKLPEEKLSRVNIAWYGNRYEDGVIPPEYEQDKRNEIINLLDKYNTLEDSSQRKKIIDFLIKFIDIKFTKIDSDGRYTMPLRDRLDKAYSILQNYLENYVGQEVL